MVSRKADKRKAIKIPISRVVGLFLLAVFVGAGVYLILSNSRFNVQGGDAHGGNNQGGAAQGSASEDSEKTGVETTEEAESSQTPKVAKIDLQPVVDAWVKSAGGNKSVLIYDIERDEVAGEYNADESYGTASLYKLFVVYEGYRRVVSGEWQAGMRAGSTGYTISECLDLAIRQSHSECAETLWGMIGHDALDEIVRRDFGVMNSDISHLASNPRDILAMMKLFYEHREIQDETMIAQMKDSFLNQPIAANGYNWRQGLPSGFGVANVYNKVGWDYDADGGYWNIYHDAAIVEFPERVTDDGSAISPARHFIVVVMTNRIPYQKIRQLGNEIEKAILAG